MCEDVCLLLESPPLSALQSWVGDKMPLSKHPFILPELLWLSPCCTALILIQNSRATGAPTEAHTVPSMHELLLLASYVGWGLVFGLLSPFYFVWFGFCFSFTKGLLTTFSVTSTVSGPGENTENKIN